jgi:hypothetical protein
VYKNTIEKNKYLLKGKAFLTNFNQNISIIIKLEYLVENVNNDINRYNDRTGWSFIVQQVRDKVRRDSWAKKAKEQVHSQAEHKQKIIENVIKKSEKCGIPLPPMRKIDKRFRPKSVKNSTNDNSFKQSEFYNLLHYNDF